MEDYLKCPSLMSHLYTSVRHELISNKLVALLATLGLAIFSPMLTRCHNQLLTILVSGHVATCFDIATAF